MICCTPPPASFIPGRGISTEKVIQTGIKCNFKNSISDGCNMMVIKVGLLSRVKSLDFVLHATQAGTSGPLNVKPAIFWIFFWILGLLGFFGFCLWGFQPQIACFPSIMINHAFVPKICTNARSTKALRDSALVAESQPTPATLSWENVN